MRWRRRDRAVLRWAVTVLCVLLGTVWLLSFRWHAYWGRPAGSRLHLSIVSGSFTLFGWERGSEWAKTAPPSLGVRRSLRSGEVWWWFRWTYFAGAIVLAIPLWLPTLAGVVGSALLWRRALVDQRRSGLVCPSCRYDRTGLGAGAVCPECGTAAV